MTKPVKLDQAGIRFRLSGVPGWTVDEQGHLVREFRFPDFASALQFVNAIGALSEERQHHPELQLGWGRVRVEVWTHSVNGLTDLDFELVREVSALEAAR